ncbi:hypothetical protein V1289_001956 [Bradyrhizobium sp. AZCC 2289]
MLRRLSNCLVDLADREGELSGSTGEALAPSSWGERPLPF